MSQALTARLLGPESWARLKAIAKVRHDGTTPTDPPAALSGAVAAITGWDTPPLTDKILDRCPDLRLIAHTGGTVRTLVPESAYDRGIRLTQASAVLAEGVAEFAVMQILAGLRDAYLFTRDMRAGVSWRDLAARPPGRLLRDQTVGIVGASRTGRATLHRLRPFGCRCLLYDPYADAGEAAELGAELVELDDLLRRSDVVSLHAPVLPETWGLLDAARLALLRDGAVLVNTARAALVEEAALLAEAESGRISALLDVFGEEPLPERSPWRTAAVATPHIAALTAETLREQGGSAAGEVARFLTGDPLLYEISRDAYRVIA
jgi:phosphoglycerate dehydrogenase-like enzyme